MTSCHTCADAYEPSLHGWQRPIALLYPNPKLHKNRHALDVVSCATSYATLIDPPLPCPLTQFLHTVNSGADVYDPAPHRMHGLYALASMKQALHWHVRQ